MSRKPERKPLPGRRTGLTLVEVLIALAVLAIALVVLLELQIRSIRLTNHADRLSRAVLLAERKVHEALLEAEPRLGTDDGTYSPPGTEASFRWERSISEAASDPAVPAEAGTLLTVDVRVSWGDGPAAREVRMSTRMPAKE